MYVTEIIDVLVISMEQGQLGGETRVYITY